jgi:hypothetical protein
MPPADTPLALAFRRCLAAGAAALVLLLTFLSASPEAHEHLHEDADHAEHSCAVVLFAHGLTFVLEVISARAPATAWNAFVALPDRELFLTAAPHLHPPERGPPAC